jgi:hypothetical protein
MTGSRVPRVRGTLVSALLLAAVACAGVGRVAEPGASGHQGRAVFLARVGDYMDDALPD